MKKIFNKLFFSLLELRPFEFVAAYNGIVWASRIKPSADRNSNGLNQIYFVSRIDDRTIKYTD